MAALMGTAAGTDARLERLGVGSRREGSGSHSPGIALQLSSLSCVRPLWSSDTMSGRRIDSLLRKDHGEHDVGREDAAVVMPALRDDDRVVLRSHRLVHILEER